MSTETKKKIMLLTEQIMNGQSDIDTLQELLVAMDNELFVVKHEDPETYLGIITSLNEFLKEVESVAT